MGGEKKYIQSKWVSAFHAGAPSGFVISCQLIDIKFNFQNRRIFSHARLTGRKKKAEFPYQVLVLFQSNKNWEKSEFKKPTYSSQVHDPRLFVSNTWLYQLRLSWELDQIYDCHWLPVGNKYASMIVQRGT